MPKPLDSRNARILQIRGHRVILDADLALHYGVPTKRLNEQVRRNQLRFPSDFSFQCTADEHESLRSQFATSKAGRGGRRYLPYAFTEHGALMAANVLNSEQAIEMSIYVVRSFVAQREALAANAAILKRLAEIDKNLIEHDSACKFSGGDFSLCSLRPLSHSNAGSVSNHSNTFSPL